MYAFASSCTKIVISAENDRHGNGPCTLLGEVHNFEKHRLPPAYSVRLYPVQDRRIVRHRHPVYRRCRGERRVIAFASSISGKTRHEVTHRQTHALEHIRVWVCTAAASSRHTRGRRYARARAVGETNIKHKIYINVRRFLRSLRRGGEIASERASKRAGAPGREKYCMNHLSVWLRLSVAARGV